MKLTNVRKETDSESVSLTGSVRRDKGAGEIEVFFRYPKRFASFVAEEADAFIPILLLPAMAEGEDLETLLPVSEKLFCNLDTIQDIFSRWFPGNFKKVRVSAPAKKEYAKNAGDNVALFFSLGVDSFYSLYKDMRNQCANRPPVSHLLYMRGFEMPLSSYKDGRDGAVIANIMEVAKAAKKDVITGETNIRDAFSSIRPGLNVGSRMAAVALSLGAGLRHALLPSSLSYTMMLQFGSSPFLDPLWSTERAAIADDGAEADRIAKITDCVIEDPLAMRYLRVCNENRGAVHNCGTCDKCLRTMIPIYLSGGLEKAGTFPKEIPRKFVFDIDSRMELYFTEESLRLAKKHGDERWLTRKLERYVNVYKTAEFLKGISFFELQKLAFLIHARWLMMNIKAKAAALLASLKKKPA